MKLNSLRPAWDRYKRTSQIPDITTDEILEVIGQDVQAGYQVQRLLYNTILFSFLIVFCQTC
ncbi:hypothetical protein DYBT9275_01056 [Dyadobacter sp. CECT 9275]|uniref:Uncharacterized protein n=1 Tax=Dyadobacter helix TaxID=2822344 RepID=A0A916J8M2_9BACT|nr:hypothetical protein [Dyadobacter sp. CECT 9275]CAG4992862.1 hypothetical protein DYBT9275_01056 [Dyadobacter sp. CECT 9275]